MFCRNCGAEVGENDKYCATCGVPSAAQPSMAASNLKDPSVESNKAKADTRTKPAVTSPSQSIQIVFLCILIGVAVWLYTTGGKIVLLYFSGLVGKLVLYTALLVSLQYCWSSLKEGTWRRHPIRLAIPLGVLVICVYLSIVSFKATHRPDAFTQSFSTPSSRSDLSKLKQVPGSQLGTQQLREMAKELNLTLPKMIDDYTRLDYATAGPRKRLTFLYTLLNVQNVQMDSSKLQSALGANVRKHACKPENLLPLLKAGTTIVYEYRYEDGSIIGDIVVNPGDCQ